MEAHTNPAYLSQTGQYGDTALPDTDGVVMEAVAEDKTRMPGEDEEAKHGDYGPSVPSDDEDFFAPEKRSRTENIRRYLISQKGRNLSMGSSVMYALTLTVIGLAILASKVLNDQYIQTANQFFITMYALSMLCITVLLGLGKLGQLTNDDHFKNQRKTSFLRGGVLALGTGGMIYYAIVVAIYLMAEPQCRSNMDLVDAIVAMVTIGTQISFLLKYSKLRINKTLGITMGGRFLLMQIIATNLCVWLRTVVMESMHEVERIHGAHHNDLHHTEYNDTEYADTYTQSTEIPDNSCSDSGEALSKMIAPYTFPLLIEFCVVSSTMLLAVWEKCGVGLTEPQHNTGNSDREKSVSFYDELYNTNDVYKQDGNGSIENGTLSASFSSTRSRQSSGSGADEDKKNSPSNYYNNNRGLLYGWVLIMASLVVVIVCLYATYSNFDNDDLLETVIYGSNIILCSSCLIVIPITMYSMSDLTFKDEEIKVVRKGDANIKRPKGVTTGLDKDLLGVTFIALLAYKVMSLIAAYETSRAAIFADGIISIVMAYMQTIFVSWYAFQKRSTVERHRHLKPGRQGLDFLRLTNFALWLINTFLLKHPAAKRIQESVFSPLAWAIISNIVQPLTILFFFHAIMCYSEVITHSYTTKYIGVVRPSKSKAKYYQSKIVPSLSMSHKKDLDVLPKGSTDDYKC